MPGGFTGLYALACRANHSCAQDTQLPQVLFHSSEKKSGQKVMPRAPTQRQPFQGRAAAFRLLKAVSSGKKNMHFACM